MDERRPAGGERVEAYLTALTSASRTPGLEYLVMNSAGVLFEHDGGWADIDRQAPVDAMTTMMAHSMSKTITAIAVLQLLEAGKIGLDDPIDHYVSTPYGSSVTVRQLITHTSGIPNPIPLRWVHPAARHATFDESAALAAVLRDHPRLSFAPGTRYAYSNIGCWLLGRIIERASGEPFSLYVSGHILRPLAITPRELGYEVADPTHHATGYLEKYSLMNLAKGFLIDRDLIGDYTGRWLEIRSHYLNGPAFGGLVGTARGFGKFLQDQLRTQSVLLNNATRSLLYAPQHIARGTPVSMTLGWHIGDLDGTRFFYKEGGGGGVHSMMRVYPVAGIASVIMTNATGFNVRECLDTADRQFLDAAVRRTESNR
jgi:CubicO group peptidase (beta-lactamase class C family)